MRRRAASWFVVFMFLATFAAPSIAAPPDDPITPATDSGDDPPPTTTRRPDPEVQSLKKDLDALREAQEQTRKELDEVRKELDEEKKLREEEDNDATASLWYAGSMASRFNKQDPINFGFNEIEANVEATLGDWVRVRTDIQIRPDTVDPEEQRTHSDLLQQGNEQTPGRFIDQMAEQGFVEITLHRGTRTSVTTGKFNPNLGLEPQDTKDGAFLSHSSTFLHGIVRSLTGVRFGISPVPAFRIEVFAAEGWNTNLKDNKMPAFGGKLDLDLPEKLTAQASFYWGKEFRSFGDAESPRLTADANLILHAIPHTRLGLEVAYGQEEVTSSAGKLLESFWLSGQLYGEVDPISWITVGARYEAFYDHQGSRHQVLTSGSGGHVHGGMLAARFKLADRLQLGTEFATRYSSQKVAAYNGFSVGPANLEMFLGAQLFFTMGDVKDDGRPSLARKLFGKW